jgi:hypothetical protein
MVRTRSLPIWNCLGVVTLLICSTSEAANGQGRERADSAEAAPSRIVAGTVVEGDIDIRTVRAALEVLPRRPERIVMVDAEALPSAHERQLRGLDAFVPVGSRVIYLRRKSVTLLAAEYSGGPYLLMLAAVIWHEMAHTEGLDERHAQEREEDLWKQFVQRSIVDSGVGLTYLDALRRRR